MKGIYSEAKQQLSNCMLHSDSEDGCGARTLMEPTRHAGHSGSRMTHSLAVPTTSAYETLERPFRSDKQRGRWASSCDFYFACTSHVFGSVIFSDVPVYGLLFGGWQYFLTSYLLAIVLYAIPMFLIQTFLGQFSSSGTISAFRVSPMFKGVGYSILLVNLCTLSYYSISAATPLVYAMGSLRSVIPWMSCDNSWNTPDCSTHNSYNENETYPHATVEFFRAMARSSGQETSSLSISWPILISAMGVWLVVLALLLKRVSFIGKTLRCACILMFGFFVAIFVYVLIHENVTWEVLEDYFKPILENSQVGIQGAARTAILLASSVLGPGWGSVLTMASYNSFHTDGERYTFWVNLTHISITVMALVCSRVAFDYYDFHVGNLYTSFEEEDYMQFIYLCFAYLFGRFTTLPNLWAFLFFAMIFMSEMCALLIQMMNILTALFDEFEQLRTKKKCITICLTLCFMGSSIYFCTQQGLKYLRVLPNVGVLLNFVIAIVVLLMSTWIYGRARFQCDLQFMLGKTISSLKIFLIRFLTPAFLLLCILQVLYLLEHNHLHDFLLWSSQGVVYIVALGYMVYKVYRTRGTYRMRLKQCFAPHDWHPVDADNRCFYEEIMGISEMLVIDSSANGNVA